MVAATHRNELKIDLKRSDTCQVVAVRTPRGQRGWPRTDTHEKRIGRRVLPVAVNAPEVGVHGRGMAVHVPTIAEHAAMIAGYGAEVSVDAQPIVDRLTPVFVYVPRKAETRRPVTVHAAGTSQTVTAVSVYSSAVAVRELDVAGYAPAMTVTALEVVVPRKGRADARHSGPRLNASAEVRADVAGDGAGRYVRSKTVDACSWAARFVGSGC
jgi:hypothetical protein